MPFTRKQQEKFGTPRGRGPRRAKPCVDDVVYGAFEEPDDENSNDFRVWDTKDRRACALIQATLLGPQIIQVSDLSARGARQYLQSKFALRDWDVYSALCNALTSLKAETDKDVETYVQQHETILARAGSSGYPLVVEAPPDATNEEVAARPAPSDPTALARFKSSSDSKSFSSHSFSFEPSLT